MYVGVALVALLAGGIGSYVVKPSASTSSSSLRLATVNMQNLKNGSKIFSSFKELMENKQKVVFEEINKIELDLKKEYEAIQKISETLKVPTQEFAQRRQDFEKKVADLDNLARTKKEELDQEFAKIATDIENTIKEIISALSKEKNLQLVLNANVLEQSVVLHNDAEFDITNEVLKRFEEKMASSPLVVDQKK